MIVLWLIIGLVFATAFTAFAKTQADGGRKAFAVGLIITALIYPVFAISAAATTQWLLIELSGVLIFGFFSLLGMRGPILWLAIGWLLHIAWDGLLHLAGDGSGFVPGWYAYACLSFDFLIAAYLAAQFRADSVSRI